MNTYPYRTYAEIDLNKMQHNLRQVRAAIGPDCKLLFVLKADAYGHGTPVCAKYSEELAARPQVIAANKTDVFYGTEEDTVISLLREEFEPKGIPVFPISAVSGKGVKELLYHVKKMLDDIHEEPTVFEREFVLDEMDFADEPYTVEYDEKENMYVVEGPRIERMLGYTNLDSEKGFQFFQKFLKTSGILEELERLGIEEGDTVRMYDLQFDYYK